MQKFCGQYYNSCRATEETGRSPIPIVDIFLLHCKVQLLANTTTITIHFQAVSHVHACIHIKHVVGEW